MVRASGLLWCASELPFPLLWELLPESRRQD